jgi:VWFA-related protein
MRTAHAIVLAAFLTAGQSLPPGQQPADTPPASRQEPFRTGVDLVHIDVSVLDQHDQPVRGLVAEDFSIRENGKPQRVVAFVPVDVPPPVAPTAPWVRDIGPDVVANGLDARRLVVILMDDGNTSSAQGESRIARDVARAVVDGLGPADLAAVMFTYRGRAQNFTADRQQLLAAVDSFTPRNPSGGQITEFGPPVASKPLECLLKHGGCTVDALKNIATFLQSAPPGRKLVFYVGSDPGLAIGGDPNNHNVVVMDMFRALQRANVSVNAFDAAGLQTFVALASDRSRQDAGPRLETARVNQDNLRILAENTGGRAFTDTNAPETQVSQVFRRNSSYYLIGFQSSDTKTDGRFRKIEVKVNQPDVEVRTRSGYYASKPMEPKATTPVSAIEAALASGIPAPDLPVQLNVAMFATPGSREASAVITAGLLQRTALAERVTVTAAAFDTAWKERGRYEQSFELPVRSPESGSLAYDVHARLPLPPGRYEVRLAVESGGRAGSVLSDIDVPDFAMEELSLSSVVLERQPALAIHNGVLEGTVPAIPTTARTFGRSDRVTAFVRIYQGGMKGIAPTSVTTRIVSDRDETAFEQTLDLGAERFAAHRAADHLVELPLERLRPGEYLLRTEAVSGTRRASQLVRFSVR